MDDEKNTPNIQDINESLKEKLPDNNTTPPEVIDNNEPSEYTVVEGFEDTADLQLPPTPSVPEEMLVETEIEPSTSARSTPPRQGIIQDIAPPPKPQEAFVASPIAPQPAAPSVAAGELKDKTFNKKRLAIIVAAVAFAVIAISIAVVMQLRGNNDSAANSSVETIAPAANAKLGIAVTVADGTIEYMRVSDQWQAVDTHTQLQEGDTIRTGTDSRAVLTLDDGSAVRLDADTRAGILSLAADDVKIEHIEGSLYSRVVPSERNYTVEVEGSTYEALGTAFVTSKDAGKSGVQVLQGAVQASDLPDETVVEGKQLFRPFGDFAGKLEITDINLDDLTENDFIVWNMNEDEKDAGFKAKLGVLEHLKRRHEEKQQQAVNLQAEEEKRKTAQKETEKLAAKKEAEKTIEKTSKEPLVRGKMNLSLSGTVLNWSYTGKATHGYKLIYSATNPRPSFADSASIYISDISKLSSSLPSKTAGTYYVRVCAYTNGTDSDPCVDYSDPVTIVIN